MTNLTEQCFWVNGVLFFLKWNWVTITIPYDFCQGGPEGLWNFDRSVNPIQTGAVEVNYAHPIQNTIYLHLMNRLVWKFCIRAGLIFPFSTKPYPMCKFLLVISGQFGRLATKTWNRYRSRRHSSSPHYGVSLICNDWSGKNRLISIFGYSTRNRIICNLTPKWLWSFLWGAKTKNTFD